MNVLVSGEFQEQARRNEIELNPSLREVVHILEGLRPETLTTHPLVKRLQGAAEEIYVLRFRGTYFYLTIRDGDVVLIGVNRG